MGYNVYDNWQRFNPPNYQYVSSVEIPKDFSENTLLLEYHESVAKLDGYVITQWSANDIDVRNPESDNAVTVSAVSEYATKLATVKYFESQLMTPSNTLAELPKDSKKKALIEKMFYINPLQNEFKLGERSALIYEVQGILIKKGEVIKHDGLYRTETQKAIKKFEADNGLFSDGKMDALTLDALLK
jgi:murein L,D-transpeptidase YcbB/YkuD